MYPILFKIGNIAVYSWGVMSLIGFALGFTLAFILGRRHGIETEDLFALLGITIITGFAGARGLYVMRNFSMFLSNPIEIFLPFYGGFDFYGAASEITVAVFLYSFIFNLSALKIIDIGTPAVLFGYAIAKIGCFLNGCCYGKETNLPWGVTFPGLSGARHPTQIYDSLAAIFVLLILLNTLKIKKFDGQVGIYGSLLFSFYRFFGDFLRADVSRYFGLSVIQILSLLVFLASLLALMFFLKKNA